MSNREEKVFKTFEEQIEGLKRKNLKFKNERFALNILKRVNYYSFINAYKENFLDLSYRKITPDVLMKCIKKILFLRICFGCIILIVK